MMALTPYTTPTNIIETLGTDPEDRPELDDPGFKRKFDENAVNIAAFLNALIAELASNSAGKGASAIGLEDSAGRITATNVEAALAELAGAGRTTETLKGLGDLISTVSGNLTTHQADSITDSDGAHGLRIEEGSWTPTIAGSTTAGTHTYSVQQGKYYKIGKQVTAFFAITMTAKGGTMAGVAAIAGLPFTADNLAYSQGGSITRAGVIDIPTSYNSLALAIPASSNVAYISIIGDGVIADFLTASGIQATTTIAGVLQYKVA
jgi:hypothetical protein